MFTTAQLIAPLFAIVIGATPGDVRPAEVRVVLTELSAPTGVRGAMLAIGRMPGVGAVARLYQNGPVKPALGYSSRPKKHVRVGVALKF